MVERDIILHLANYGCHIRRYEIMLPNVFVQHDSEADLFCIRKSGLCDEFEIKTTRENFKTDKNKFVRYRDLLPEEYKQFDWNDRSSCPAYKSKRHALIDGDMCVNYFWYVVLEGVATVDDVPPFAGLIIVLDDGRLQIKKQPKKLHGRKMEYEDRYKIARKCTYRFWKLQNKMFSLSNPDQRYRTKTIKSTVDLDGDLSEALDLLCVRHGDRRYHINKAIREFLEEERGFRI